MPLLIVRNNITEMNVDAIVNTANPLPMVGTGVDSAIYKKAGWMELLRIRQKIGKLAVSNIAVTPALNLKAKYIVHVVGPRWRGGDAHEAELLTKCSPPLPAQCTNQQNTWPGPSQDPQAPSLPSLLQPHQPTASCGPGCRGLRPPFGTALPTGWPRGTIQCPPRGRQSSSARGAPQSALDRPSGRVLLCAVLATELLNQKVGPGGPEAEAAGPARGSEAAGQ